MASTPRLLLDARSSAPLFRRIVDAIVADIRSGRLAVGTSLPGTRRLAQTLGVHRNTTLAAYRELASAGWIDTAPGRGTVVASGPRVVVPARSRIAAPIYAVQSRRHDDAQASRVVADAIALSHMPDPRHAPHVALARAYRRALRRAPVLDYANRRDPGSTFGHPRLRAAFAQMLAQHRGVVATGDDVLVTSGSQMALYLAALALVEPGDTIAVEALGFRPVWEAFRAAGAKLVPIAVDRDGLDVDALATLARRERIRAVYVTPHHQHPTGAQLSSARRHALLELAVAERFAILEDDFDGDFAYDERGAPPLACSDPHGAVVYIASMAKLIAPGIRLGFAVAPRRMLEAMAERRSFIDRQGDHALDLAVAELIEDGELRRHHQRMTAVYRARRDALASALRDRLGEAVRFEVPTHGTAVWAETSEDVDAWHARALAGGVSFAPGSGFTFDGSCCGGARFGFAGVEAARIEEAVDRLTSALVDARPRSRTGTS